MVYTYSDKFIVDSIPDIELQEYETQAIKDVGKLNITDADFVERLVVARVYMLASAAQIESDGMKEKYAVYEKEYKRALDEAILSAKSESGIKDADTVWTVKVGRS